MLLRAINQIGSGAKGIAPGSVFEIDDKEGRILLSQGAAMAAKEGAKPVKKIEAPVIKQVAVEGVSSSAKIEALAHIVDNLQQTVAGLVKRMDQLESETIDEDAVAAELSEISGINEDLARALIGAGIYSGEDMVSAGIDELVKISGIGEKKAAQLIETLEK